MTTEKIPDYCIVGAGIAGALLAHELTRAGRSVVVIEAGRRWDFAQRVVQLRDHEVLGRPMWEWSNDGRDRFVDRSPDTAGCRYELNEHRLKGVGGSTLHWGGRINRLAPSDFRTASTYGLGRDWPIGYDTLEPFYSEADWTIGISGHDDPQGPSRSRPFPMSGFPKGVNDLHWETIARSLGMPLRLGSFAIASEPYQGRSHCLAYANCEVCPSGARYSADRHIDAAIGTGRCTLLTETVARRIEVGRDGRVRAIHASRMEGSDETIVAREYVVAAHAVESARLLLLSGIGNRSDQLGRNFMEHPYIVAHGHVPKRTLYPFRIGFSRLESIGFYEGAERRHRGAVKLEFSYQHDPLVDAKDLSMWGDELRNHDREHFGHWMVIEAETEHQPNPDSRVSLDPVVRDQFGDPAPRIELAFSNIDLETQSRAREIIDRVLRAAGAESVRQQHLMFASHHMGTCRMSDSPDEGVVDSQCRVHGIPNLHLSGSAVFPTSGAMQPTATVAALSLRLARHLLDQPFI